METYYLVEELPLAIEYGMSLDDFWNGDFDLLFAYEKAYINKLHKQAHLQGLYINLALSVSLSNMFKKNSQRPVEYPKEDIFNPFKTTIKNNNSTISKIDTSKNNNELYQLKKKIEERRKLNGK